MFLEAKSLNGILAGMLSSDIQRESKLPFPAGEAAVSGCGSVFPTCSSSLVFLPVVCVFFFSPGKVTWT